MKGNGDREENRNTRGETLRRDSIDLSTLPKNVAAKAIQIINAIEKGTCYTTFRGKRLRHNRLIISIPVTRNYRLICRDYGSFVAPQAVVSHEDYNVCKPGI
ncbi:MAG: hypothetical protein N3D76_07560 [Geminocystis sp.]|nr:hypothetical protein [Geminocystis sp.]HIK37741.1 hypothetical protein [Geminocystis sp. M7585_C2015_104]